MSRAPTFHCQLVPSSTRFPCPGTASILASALAAGASVPFSCQRGACGSCLAEVVDGRHERIAAPGPDSFAVGADQLLMCQCRAAGDLTLRIPNWASRRPDATRHAVRVAAREAWPGDVMRLVLALDADDRLASLPGQHARLMLDDGDHRCFSIANHRDAADPLEFHVRRVPGGAFSDLLLSTLAVGDRLVLEGACGEVVCAMGASHTWHPTYVRFGPDTRFAWSQPLDRQRVLREDDLFFIDVGLVWDGYGDTFVRGDDAAHARCAEAARAIFRETRVAWTRGVSGTELYTFAEGFAADRGFDLVPDVEGHRIADFPHALYGKQHLADADFAPADGIWVLEIQLRDRERPIGAFFEDVLLRDAAPAA